MQEHLAVVSYNFIQRKYNFNALLRRLIRLDYAYMRGLTKAEEGTQRNWVHVFRKSPYSSGYLVNDRLDIFGYWHFVALKKRHFERAKRGMS